MNTYKQNTFIVDMYSVSQIKLAPPKKTFCDIFTCGEPMYLKISLVISQTYSYVYTNFGQFIRIFAWNVLLLPVEPLTFTFGVDYVQCWGRPSIVAQCAVEPLKF